MVVVKGQAEDTRFYDGGIPCLQLSLGNYYRYKMFDDS